MLQPLPSFNNHRCVLSPSMSLRLFYNFSPWRARLSFFCVLEMQEHVITVRYFLTTLCPREKSFEQSYEDCGNRTLDASQASERFILYSSATLGQTSNDFFVLNLNLNIIVPHSVASTEDERIHKHILKCKLLECRSGSENTIQDRLPSNKLRLC